MIRKVNPSRKQIKALFLGLCLLFIAGSAQAQIFKKKNKEKKDDKRSDYAYQTFSTTQRKEKRKSFTGEAKFHFEKPLLPVEYGKIDRAIDYAKAPYFGHKRPPIRRAPGNTKLCKVCGIKH